MEEDIPKPIVIKIKRKYTKRSKPNAEVNPTSLELEAQVKTTQNMPLVSDKNLPLGKPKETTRRTS